MMSRRFLLSLALFVAPVLSAQELKPAPVRLACLGDSITHGAKVDPKTESYPAQLQQLLGDRCVVKNFGVGGATMMRRGKANAFQQLPNAKEFQPQLVIVSFGINDTRSRGVDYWNHFAEFVPDTTALLEEIIGWSTRPRVILCLPISNYADLPGMPEDRKQNNAERVPRMAEVRAKLKEVAGRFADRGVTVVDLGEPTANHPELYDVDGVHMKATGYRLLAEILHPAVEKLLAQPAAPLSKPR
jgi:lysophospholipase L1-like esterase